MHTLLRLDLNPKRSVANGRNPDKAHQVLHASALLFLNFSVGFHPIPRD